MVARIVAALGATLGWWMGILVGISFGAPIGFLVSPLSGRAIGGIIAGLVAGAIEARSTSALRGKRLRFTGATALATALVTVVLLDVQSLPWLVGAAFGAAIGLAQAGAVGLGRRDASVRAAALAVGWSFGFLVLKDGGALSKLGVLAPALSALLIGLAASPRVSRLGMAPATVRATPTMCGSTPLSS